ncbi:MAG: cation:proton antiporter [Gammaproteobacteria bacterium]
MAHASIVVQSVITSVVVLTLASFTLLISRRLHLPFAVGLVFAGFGFAYLVNQGPEVIRPLSEIKISHDLIFFVLLPTLVFESAYDLDAWQLRHNILPILTLALPGVILSTAMIGLLVGWLTPIDYPTAFLLGAVLSAIDHVSVSSVFKQMGAPKRLIILVEGESLFSDVTLIVLAYILLDVVLAGNMTAGMALTGIGEFFKVLLGGISIGLVCGYVTGYVIGKINDNPFFEISGVLTLAYASFLIAEYGFHVSGVMATAACGLVMSGWGRSKISPSVREYLEDVWRFLAFVAMAVIFLSVGYLTDPKMLIKVSGILLWVILAVLTARAVVVFGLMPIIAKLPNSDPIDLRYQAAMYWGGIRGAVALALTMSLGDFDNSEQFRALVTGVVLFTLLVPGFSLRWIIKKLGLDKPSLDERFALVETILTAKQHALASMSGLQAGGLFSARIAKDLEKRYRDGIDAKRDELDTLRVRELDARKEVELLTLRCLSEEKTYYFDMFNRAHITDQAYRQLTFSVDLQIDSLRYRGKLPVYTSYPENSKWHVRYGNKLMNLKLLGFATEVFRSALTAREYEQVWARQQATLYILNNLEKMSEHSSRTETLVEVKRLYKHWNEAAKRRIDQVAEQFPEFVNAMQHKFAERLFLHAERESILEKEEQGTLTERVAKKLLEDIGEEIRRLRGRETRELKIGSTELLKKVPFFQAISPVDFEQISTLLHSVIVPAGKFVFEQGDSGDSLYLIARGVLRVSIKINGEVKDVATMIAGDFFGEMALLNKAPRTATTRAITPCVLYELKKKDFDSIRKTFPIIESTLVETERRHFEDLQKYFDETGGIDHKLG